MSHGARMAVLAVGASPAFHQFDSRRFQVQASTNACWRCVRLPKAPDASDPYMLISPQALLAVRLQNQHRDTGFVLERGNPVCSGFLSLLRGHSEYCGPRTMLLDDS